MISVQDILMATTNSDIKVEVVINRSIPSFEINNKDLWKQMICDGITNVVFNDDNSPTIYVTCIYVDKNSVTDKTIDDLKSICRSEFRIKILDYAGVPIMGFDSSVVLNHIDEYTADKRISSMIFKLVDNKVELSVYLYDRIELRGNK